MTRSTASSARRDDMARQALALPAASAPVCTALADSGSPCLPCSLVRADNDQIEALQVVRRRVRRREALYLQGEPFRAVYVLRAGSCKSVLVAPDGVEQVTGFHLAGELLGLDGLADESHGTSAFALEDGELLALPCDPAAGLPGAFARLLSRELARERARMLLLAHRSAEARVTEFLVDVSRRMLERGYSGQEFLLRMTRAEIGNYLGLSLETVSRRLSALQQQGLLAVDGRHVRLKDPTALLRPEPPGGRLH